MQLDPKSDKTGRSLTSFVELPKYHGYEYGTCQAVKVLGKHPVGCIAKEGYVKVASCMQHFPMRLHQLFVVELDPALRWVLDGLNASPEKVQTFVWIASIMRTPSRLFIVPLL